MLLNTTSSARVGSVIPDKIYVGSHEIWSASVPAWSPSYLGSGVSLWLDASDLNTLTLNGPSISQWSDKSGNGYHALQPVAAEQPTYPAEQDRVIFNATNRLLTTLPATTGTLVLGTTDGTAAYSVNIPAGSYDIGRRGGLYMPDDTAYGYILSDSAMSQATIDAAIAYLREKGAGQNYGSVTSFQNYWRDWSEITEFPLIDTSAGINFRAAWYNCISLTTFPLINTSSGTDFQFAWRSCANLVSFPLIDTSAGTNFSYAWYNCTSLANFALINTSSGTVFSYAWYNCASLTSFPLIDTGAGTNFQSAWYNCSSLTSFPLINTIAGTNFQSAWQNCSSLTNFPANFFNNCLATNFSNAFLGTNLSQQSIDNILVSIESNGTSNGTFNQSGGSAPSATGESAITALRSRGWTVTVTVGL
jgi:hypothetical protein